MANNKYGKKAFTLAEVLITIGIVGVVAAMTLPSFVAKYRSKVVVTRLKKLYSVTQQAMLKAMPDGDYNNIPITDGNTTGAVNFFENYLEPQFNILNTCGPGTDADYTLCWKQTKYRDGTSYGYTWGKGAYAQVVDFITADGFCYNVDTWDATDWETVKEKYGVNVTGTTPMAVIHVDANCMSSPNIIGKDVFVFVLNEKGLIPAGSDKTDDEVETECKDTGLYCFANIIRNNWTIDPDDAW